LNNQTKRKTPIKSKGDSNNKERDLRDKENKEHYNKQLMETK